MHIIDFISSERIKTYEKHTDSTKRAIALHNQTLQLGASLMSMIALLELSLRNSTNQRIIEDFGDDKWLLKGSETLPLQPNERIAISRANSQARKALYAKLTYRQKNQLDAFAFPGGKPPNMTHEKTVKARQAQFIVSHGQVISQTTFVFWKRLYAREYENSLWKPSIKKIFPNRNLKRSDISKNLEVIYATRNRVAHHEPVYGQRLEDAMVSLDFIRNSLGARRENDNSKFKDFSKIQHLRLQMDYANFIEAWRTLT